MPFCNTTSVIQQLREQDAEQATLSDKLGRSIILENIMGITNSIPECPVITDKIVDSAGLT